MINVPFLELLLIIHSVQLKWIQNTNCVPFSTTLCSLFLYIRKQGAYLETTLMTRIKTTREKGLGFRQLLILIIFIEIFYNWLY